MVDPGFTNGRGQGRRRFRVGEVWGGGVPLPINFFDFGSQNGDFMCIILSTFLQFT